MEEDYVTTLEELKRMRNLTSLGDEFGKILPRKNSVLVIAAHPDDEVLGCGGVISRHIDNGDLVKIAIFSMGLTSRYNDNDEVEPYKTEKLHMVQCIKEAHRRLGVTTSPVMFFHPDQQFDTTALLVFIREIEGLIVKLLPNIIYTHFMGDLNQDHRIISQATITACRPKPENSVDTLLFYEVPSSTEWTTPSTFNPNYFVDISGQCFNNKIKALEAYDLEIRDFPHPRSSINVANLAAVRGSSVGFCYAEAFMVGRQLVWG